MGWYGGDGEWRRAGMGGKELEDLRAVVDLVEKSFFVIEHLLEFIWELLLWRGRGGVFESLNDVGRVFLGRHDRRLISAASI